MNKDIRVCIYSDYPSTSLDTDLVIENLKQYDFHIENRGNLLDFLSLTEQNLYKLSRSFSSIQIQDISIPLDSTNPPDSSEIEIEMNKLLGRESVIGKFYDGYWVQRILHNLLSEKVHNEMNSRYMHLIFTGRLFGSFEDRRYHARVVLMGSPALVSTSGLVEAPAKPKEYYYVKGRLIQSGMGTSELDNMYRGRFVEYDDPKISSILPSYALQAIFYELTANPFCDNPICCLSNSHWQEEVLKVQFEGVPCERCKGLLSKK
ncbi:MAG: hypothetical protein DHS20C13_27160 [Thermodesulfobacteriota bacterium]|nr:MAG: hypothetical protein DHS20C13_27160 [Thermodesulfobacteriota bacterium]